MDIAQEYELQALARQKPMNDVIERGDSDVQQFYCDVTVFVTGGSGFIGKQLIEKLFRSCKIKKLYLLMRGRKGKTVQERMPEIFGDPVFDVLRKKQPNFVDKIIPIEGDVAQLGLGISEEKKQILINEVEVIFHAAASIAFAEPIRSATLTNLRGTREIVSLAKLCTKLKSFVYTSTAYTHAIASKIGTTVREQFYPCPMCPDLMIQMAETLDDSRLNDITNGLLQGWPNTYSFTKTLAEEFIRANAGDLPLCVVRPAIVISANREPMPGWIDKSNVNGPSGLLLGVTMGVIHVMRATDSVKLDFIPVDYVVNAILTAATTAKTNPLTVYNVGSSARNPITFSQFSYNLRHKVGKSILSPKILWYCFAFNSRNKFVCNILAFFLHTLPAYLMDGILLIIGQPPKFRKMYDKIDKIISVFSYFVNNQWIFDDSNTLALFRSLSKTDQVIFHHDIADVEWADQVYLWVIGLRKYVVKDGLKDTKYGMKKQFYFSIITYVIFALFIYCCWLFLRMLFLLF